MPRRVGTVSHISKRGTIILRCDRPPPLGVEVVDKRVEPVGMIVDVFGPVKHPYVAVRPYSPQEIAERKARSSRKIGSASRSSRTPLAKALPEDWPHSLIGAALYTVEQKRRRERRP